MRYLFCLILLIGNDVLSQMPRSGTGSFEYTSRITVDAATVKSLEEKAARFFNQPFLVHWDTIYRQDKAGAFVMKGSGYVDVKAKLHSVATPRNIPVSLELTLEVYDGGYRYTFTNFEVDRLEKGPSFEFEKKPDSLKQMTYDQLLQKTHKRISFVTGYLKKYMRGEE